jgi:hypothetical protein
MEIGLGDATQITRLEIWWPASGIRQVFSNVPLDCCLAITEGERMFVECPLPRMDFEQHLKKLDLAKQTP